MAVAGLLEAEVTDAFLVVTVRATGDFVQFTAVPGKVQVDFPQVTQRQRQLRPKVEETCRELGLALSTDGSEFLDYEISGSAESIATIVRELFRGVFGVASDRELLFDAQGFDVNDA